MMHNFEIEEADRQMMLLSLALCSLLRPGFDYAAGEIAEKLQGRAMFEDFKRFNADVVHPQQMAPTKSVTEQTADGQGPQIEKKP